MPLNSESLIESNLSDENKSRSELYAEVNKLRAELTALYKAAEKGTDELCKSEERFSLAMRGANDGLWDWDLETDAVYYSPRWKSMLGFEEDELENSYKTWECLVHDEDKNFVLQNVRRYIAGQVESFDVEMRMQHKKG